MTFRILSNAIATGLDKETNHAPEATPLIVPDTAPETAGIQDELRPPLERYVSGMMRDVLGRPASTPELNGWVGQMLAGVSRTTLALCLLNSNERRERLVEKWYAKFMKRAPSLENLRYWCDLFARGKSADEVLAAILSSPEYLSLQPPTNEGFARAMFRDVLERRPGTMETDVWVGLLDSGSATKMAVVFQFVCSEEYRKKIIRDWYWTFLNREADPEGLQSAQEQLQHGNPHESVIANLLATREYFNRTLLK